MKTITIIESVEELIKIANPHRIEGDETPFILRPTIGIFRTTSTPRNLNDFKINIDHQHFRLGQEITLESFIRKLASLQKIKIDLIDC